MPNIRVTISLVDKVSPKSKKISNQLDHIASAANRAGRSGTNAFSNMERQSRRTHTALSKLKSTNLGSLRAQFKQLGNTISNVNKTSNQLTRTVARLAATYLGVMGMKGAISQSDLLTSAANRIGDMNGTGYDSALTQETMDKIYTASKQSRSFYGDMLATTSKMYTLANEAFGKNIDNAIEFNKIMQQAYVIGGASAEEMSSSMYQLTQALGAGVLQGDELRSVREGAPLAYREIEKFAQKVYQTSDSLKDMASNGQITSALVVQAMMNASDQIEERFEKTQVTFGQMWAMFKSDALIAFRPFLNKLNEIANNDSFQEFVGHAVNGLRYLGAAFTVIANVVGVAVDFMVEHWSFFKWIFVYFMSIMIASLLIGVGKAAWGFLRVGVQVAIFIAELALTAAWYTILAVKAWICALAQGYAWAWVILIIFFVIAVIFTLSSAYAKMANIGTNAIGILVGAAYALGTAFMNVLKFIANLGIATWEWIVYGFNSAVYGIKIALGVLASAFTLIFAGIWDTCIAVVNAIGKAIVSMINGIIDTINLFVSGANKIADIMGKEKLSLISTVKWDGFDYYNPSNDLKSISDWVGDAPTKPNYGRFEYGNLGEAYRKGYAKGEAFSNSVSDKISGLKNKITDGMKNFSDAAKTPNYAEATPDMSSVGSPNAGKLGSAGDVGKIKDNTSKIKDSVSDLDENFDYLISLAERDAINRFTTATIKVEMTNNNNLSQNADVDGIINTLSDRLAEELGVVAAGTHY